MPSVCALPVSCDGCRADFSLTHALDCHKRCFGNPTS